MKRCTLNLNKIYRYLTHLDTSENTFLYKKFESDKNSEIARIHISDMMCDYCVWIREILARIEAETEIEKRKKIKPRVDPVVVVHGGAGEIPRYARKFMLDEVKLLFLLYRTMCKSFIKKREKKYAIVDECR